MKEILLAICFDFYSWEKAIQRRLPMKCSVAQFLTPAIDLLFTSVDSPPGRQSSSLFVLGLLVCRVPGKRPCPVVLLKVTRGENLRE